MKNDDDEQSIRLCERGDRGKRELEQCTHHIKYWKDRKCTQKPIQLSPPESIRGWVFFPILFYLNITLYVF